MPQITNASHFIVKIPWLRMSANTLKIISQKPIWVEMSMIVLFSRQITGNALKYIDYAYGIARREIKSL